MFTAAAARSLVEANTVLASTDLPAGITRSRMRANLAARRWQRVGGAIVLHNHEPRREEWWEIARLNGGPRAALTAFTSAEKLGLRGYERDEVHLLVPAGTKRRSDWPDHAPRLRLHFDAEVDTTELLRPGLHRMAPSLVRATSTFSSARTACGALAAAVQQRLVLPQHLESAFAGARSRHSGVLRLAIGDIAQGAQALSELDFVQLCAKHGLPAPELQVVRVDGSGRRRYLDASWRRGDGRVVVVEVDGAIHLQPRVWFDDQLRQNEVVLTDALVLRYPSIIVRTEPKLVVAQLRRALLV